MRGTLKVTACALTARFTDGHLARFRSIGARRCSVNIILKYPTLSVFRFVLVLANVCAAGKRAAEKEKLKIKFINGWTKNQVLYVLMRCRMLFLNRFKAKAAITFHGGILSVRSIKKPRATAFRSSRMKSKLDLGALANGGHAKTLA